MGCTLNVDKWRASKTSSFVTLVILLSLSSLSLYTFLNIVEGHTTLTSHNRVRCFLLLPLSDYMWHYFIRFIPPGCLARCVFFFHLVHGKRQLSFILLDSTNYPSWHSSQGRKALLEHVYATLFLENPQRYLCIVDTVEWRCVSAHELRCSSHIHTYGIAVLGGNLVREKVSKTAGRFELQYRFIDLSRGTSAWDARSWKCLLCIITIISVIVISLPQWWTSPPKDCDVAQVRGIGRASIKWHVPRLTTWFDTQLEHQVAQQGN